MCRCRKSIKDRTQLFIQEGTNGQRVLKTMKNQASTQSRPPTFRGTGNCVYDNRSQSWNRLDLKRTKKGQTENKDMAPERT